MKEISIGGFQAGPDRPLFFICGPCVIESRDGCLAVARELASLAAHKGVNLIFKASFDKANRTSVNSFRGPGLERGLEILAEVKAETGLPLCTDVHESSQAAPVAEVCDVLQVPAFLCRQTDLLLTMGETGRVINVKKGQFLAPGDMRHVIAKIEHTDNHNILLTERGVSFGYNNLVADMRSLIQLADFGYPVVFDATHSVQRPGGGDGFTAGDGPMAPSLARAAVATGCQGIFMETHLNPAEALSDRENAIPFGQLEAIWDRLAAIHAIVTPGLG